MKTHIIIAAFAAATLSVPAFAGGAITGGATEWTQLANHAELVSSVGQQIQTVANTLQTAQQTMRMLQALPATVIGQLTGGLPIAKVQALATAYQTFSRASDAYQQAAQVLRQAQAEGQGLGLSPADYLKYRATLAQTAGGQYQQQYEDEIGKLQRLAQMSGDVQHQVAAVQGINSQVGGLQTIASQNLQVETLLGGISSSISQANAIAASQAKQAKDTEGRAALLEAQHRAAFERAQQAPTGDELLKLPSDYQLVK